MTGLTYYYSMESQPHKREVANDYVVYDRESLTANSKVEYCGGIDPYDSFHPCNDLSPENHMSYTEPEYKDNPSDMVNHPDHYTINGVEAIDVIQAKLSEDQFLGYCVANALKYLMRQNYKGKQQEDIKKACWYLNRLVDSFEG